MPESSIIIEYLDQHYPGRVRLIPPDPDLARETRFRDRFYDLYVHEPMQKIVTDKLRPAGKNDPHGVETARALLRTSLGMVDQDMAAKTWAMGEAFTMADCAASPALFYADKVMPLGAAPTRRGGTTWSASSSGPPSPACWRRRSHISKCSQARARRRLWCSEHRNPIAVRC